MEVLGALHRGPADGSVGEREGEKCRQGLRQIVTGICEFAKDRCECFEVGDRVGLGLLDHAGADAAELVERPKQPHQIVSLCIDHFERTGQVVEGTGDRTLLLVGLNREAIDFFQRGDEALLVLVELTHERVGRGQQLLDLRLIAVEGLAEFPDDRLGLFQPAAIEKQRGCAQDFFDLRVTARTIERDEITIAERSDRTGLRCREGDELFAQKAGQTNLRLGVVGELGIAIDFERDDGCPAVEHDLAYLANRDVVHTYGALRHQIENVAELHLHGIGIVADIGAPGKWQRVGRESAPTQSKGKYGSHGYCLEEGDLVCLHQFTASMARIESFTRSECGVDPGPTATRGRVTGALSRPGVPVGNLLRPDEPVGSPPGASVPR